MVDFITLALSNLFLDAENPRLDNPQESQTEAIRALISAPKQKQKLVNLATDILENGLNPSEAMIVMPHNGTKQYIVLEGNRRLAAIKILENPDSFKGLFSNKVQTVLQNLSQNYQKKPIHSVQCVMVKDRDEARHWIELRHEGQQEGVGIVPWGAAEAARFRQVYGQKEIHLQVLDFLQEQGVLTPEERQSVPITSLKRVIEDSYTREKLGYQINRGEFIPGENKTDLASTLKQVVNDFSTGRKKVRDVYHKQDRVDYVDDLLKHQAPSKVFASDTPIVKIIEPNSQNGTLPENLPGIKSASTIPDETQNTISPESDNPPLQDGNIQKRSIPIDKTRLILIPSRVTLRIDQPRINEIYYELRRISLVDYPNAVAVLFRVFLELSVDAYIFRYKSEFPKDPADVGYRLGTKLEDVVNHLKNAKKLSDQEAKPVRRAAQSDTFIAASVTTMNQYVHNRYFKPSPEDLRVAWDNLQFFIQKIWE